jgi:hypothetical protein
VRAPLPVTTFTAYLDPSQGIVHELICEVSANGAHRVINSDVRSTRESAEQIRQAANVLFHPEHVRVYSIREA